MDSCICAFANKLKVIESISPLRAQASRTHMDITDYTCDFGCFHVEITESVSVICSSTCLRDKRACEGESDYGRESQHLQRQHQDRGCK